MKPKNIKKILAREYIFFIISLILFGLSWLTIEILEFRSAKLSETIKKKIECLPTRHYQAISDSYSIYKMDCANIGKVEYLNLLEQPTVLYKSYELFKKYGYDGTLNDFKVLIFSPDSKALSYIVFKKKVQEIAKLEEKLTKDSLLNYHYTVGSIALCTLLLTFVLRYLLYAVNYFIYGIKWSISQLNDL